MLIDDGADPAALRNVTLPLRTRTVILPNPRKGRGFGFTGGLTVGILSGLQWIEANCPVDFVLKMDPDSLVIAPFAKRLADLFSAHPSLAMAGSHRHHPNGTENDTGLDWGPLIERLYRPLTFWKRNPYGRRRLQVGVLGRAREIRRIMRDALLNGYAFGDHCQGGGYAVSRHALKTFRAKGFFRDPLLFLDSPLTEDITLGLLAKSAGLKMKDFNQPGEVFGVKFKGLSAPPPELAARGYGVIHSVKDFEEVKESEVRGYFRDRRRRGSDSRV